MQMTANRRIALNVIATYGRSLFALLCGLFTARWTLQALGEVDYGLYGVVGGLTAFIAFFNGLLATAIGRFYAVSVGQAQAEGQAEIGLENCRQWFSIAVFIHTVIPLVLMCIGYPIGEWAVRHWLTIPLERIEACVWVFRFVCVTCFVGMVNVPFSAMYGAKQYIAELTIYSFVTTTLNVGFLYYMVTHPGVWLAKLALWAMLLSVIPQLIICLRALKIFPECRFRWRYCMVLDRFRELLYFVGWWVFGQLGTLLRSQGIQVLVNRFFGPRMNATMSIAGSVNAHTMTLSGSMIGAFQPAIVAAYGAGDLERMRALSYRACKLSMVFILLFMLPLALELHEVLRLWLKTPPQCVYGVCMIMFLMTVIDQSAVGHMLAVNARGKIALYQIVLGGSLLFTLPLAWLLCFLGCNIYAVAFSMLITMLICAWGRVWFARTLVGMSARYWLFKILLPVCGVVACSAIVGCIPQLFFAPSFLRVLLTGIVCEMIFVPLVYLFVIEQSDRALIKKKVANLLERLKR